MSEILKQIGSFLGVCETEESKTEPKKPHDMIGIVYATGEWFIVAFAVTLVFIVFFMQAYTIPTGSMADTLRGAHFRLRCEQCGYRYEYGFLPSAYRWPENYTPGKNVDIKPSRPQCPSCGFKTTSGQEMPVMKGDRIFVAKCLYQFYEPNRWDVVVFKNPTEPRINYIKRLIAKPGEEVEIIDGDIYINGKIARKPKKVQEEMWMCIYDNDYQPADPDQSAFNGHTWRQPFTNTDKSEWNLSPNGSRVFSLQSDEEEVHTLVYDTRKGNDFRATYAYNDVRYNPLNMPVCSDLMIRYYLLNEGWTGKIGAVLSKYGVKYLAMVNSNGRMEILKAGKDGKNTLLAGENIQISSSEDKQLRFYNVDHKLVLEFGKHAVSYDLGVHPDDAGDRNANIEPEVMIFGGGKVKIAHIGIFRDLHYIDEEISTGKKVRGGEGNPFKLGEDEFFACGDNSPSSYDARLWNIPGKGNNGNEYRMGVVPRDYLVGKAVFVYWPGGFKFRDKSRIRLVPYIGGMKRIYGGEYRRIE